MAFRHNDSAIRIMEAYEAAKKNDPTLSQGQFLRQGAPGFRLDKAPGKFKSDDSAARYFRKIRSGERSGAAMYEAAQPSSNIRGLFQFKVRLEDGRFISQNITVAGGTSTFDIPNIEHQLRGNKAEQVEELVRHYQQRYEMAEAEIDMETLEVRPIATQRKSIRMRLGVDFK